MTETKIYPTGCTSAFCGRTKCDGCPSKPILDKFNQWVADTGAVQSDRIWNPTVYVAHDR